MNRLASLTLLGMMPGVALAGDLSTYRNFRLGSDLTTVARQISLIPAQAKVIHRRPALIQELDWRPQPLGSSSQAETVKAVVFRFLNGDLYRIAVQYDRYETEGMTADDLVEAISATYGVAAKLPDPAIAALGRDGDREDLLAQWQDALYRFDLIRSSYGPSYRLIGVLKRLEAPAQAASLEASRLDDQEAPQREAARIAGEEEAARVKLEKARLLNKPKFRP
jgi:hypothetical protein